MKHLTRTSTGGAMAPLFLLIALIAAPRGVAAAPDATHPAAEPTPEAAPDAIPPAAEPTPEADPLAPATAPAPELPIHYRARATSLEILRGDEMLRVLPIDCRGSAVLHRETKLHVGCENGLIIGFDVTDPLAPKVASRHEMGAPIRGLRMHEGKVLATLGKPAPAISAPAKPPASASETPAEPHKPRVRPTGAVVRVQPRYVVVDFGRQDGARTDDRVELYHYLVIDLGDGKVTRRAERLAVGTISDVGEDRSLVEVDVHERVHVGALAKVTEEATSARPLAPPRLGGLLELRLLTRPFLAWRARGAGGVFDASLIYRLHAPVAFHLVGEPIGFGVAGNGNVVATTAHGLVTWDTWMFEVGIGAGWTVVRGKLEDSALAIPQVMRIGAVDGFNFRVFNQFVLLEDRWGWGGTNGQVEVPVWASPKRWWIVVGGGAGIAAYGFVEAGAKVLVVGDGDAGSLYLRATGGYAQLKQGKPSGCTQGVDDYCHAGPMFGLGIEGRAGRLDRKRSSQGPGKKGRGARRGRTGAP